MADAAARAVSAKGLARSSVGGVRPPDSITDGVVVLRQFREDDRAVVLSTMRDPLVREWLNVPREPGDDDFESLLRIVREATENK